MQLPSMTTSTERVPAVSGIESESRRDYSRNHGYMVGSAVSFTVVNVRSREQKPKQKSDRLWPMKCGVVAQRQLFSLANQQSEVSLWLEPHAIFGTFDQTSFEKVRAVSLGLPT